MALGSMLVYYALSFERIIIASPLMQIEPLFVLFFTYFYLRELEHVTDQMVISAIIIVFGGILVSLS